MAPTVQATGAIGPAVAEATYAVDAWTGASVDVMTAATPAIRENRHEVDATLRYAGRAITVSSNYRFSTENDYQSHGLTLGLRAELAGKNTTLSLDVLGSEDRVGRAGDPSFSRPVETVGGRFTLAQILDQETLAEVGWQVTRVDGYQASPYRFVAIGDVGTCASRAPFCIPEQVPDQRTRNALTLRARRALGRTIALGLDYRFYFDDWGMQSHALQPDLIWRVADEHLVTLRYRYTTQSEASFYRPRYFTLDATGFATRDRKLSAIVGNDLGLQYLRRHESEDGEHVYEWGLRTTLSRVDYLAFVGLDHVWALELTALVGIELP